MTKWQRFKHEVWLIFHQDLRWGLISLKRRIWDKRIKLWWNKLFLRKNELDPSLDMDYEAMSVMNDKEFGRYQADLVRRRTIAHKKDIEKE